jgi:hypothetical protein
MPTELQCGKIKERNHLEDLVIEGKEMLKLVLINTVG